MVARGRGRAAPQVVVLVLDGVGWHQLQRRRHLTPTLAGMQGGPIRTVLPTTTATALTSITTGTPPGEHGVVGYRIPDRRRGPQRPALDHPPGRRPGARPRRPRSSPCPRSAPSDPPAITRTEFERSGFTGAHLDGVRFRGWRVPSTLVTEVAELTGRRRAVRLRLLRRRRQGEPRVRPRRPLRRRARRRRPPRRRRPSVPSRPARPSWSPPTTARCTSAPTSRRSPPRWPPHVDYQSGEARFRWLHAVPGPESVALLDAARDAHGDRAWVRTRDEMIDEGWFGPMVTDAARQRLRRRRPRGQGHRRLHRAHRHRPLPPRRPPRQRHPRRARRPAVGRHRLTSAPRRSALVLSGVAGLRPARASTARASTGSPGRRYSATTGRPVDRTRGPLGGRGRPPPMGRARRRRRRFRTTSQAGTAGPTPGTRHRPVAADVADLRHDGRGPPRPEPTRTRLSRGVEDLARSRQGRLEGQVLPGDRVVEGEPGGVEEQPGHRHRPPVAAVVGVVAHDRVADGGEVHPDLVGAPGLERAAQQRAAGVGPALDHLVAGARLLAPLADRHLRGGAGGAPERGVDQPGVGLGRTVHERQVDPLDVARRRAPTPGAAGRLRCGRRPAGPTCRGRGGGRSRGGRAPRPSAISGYRATSPCTSVPVTLPAPGCTTRPAGLSTTSTSSSSWTTASGTDGSAPDHRAGLGPGIDLDLVALGEPHLARGGHRRRRRATAPPPPARRPRTGCGR